MPEYRDHPPQQGYQDEHRSVDLAGEVFHPSRECFYQLRFGISIPDFMISAVRLWIPPYSARVYWEITGELLFQ